MLCSFENTNQTNFKYYLLCVSVRNAYR